MRPGHLVELDALVGDEDDLIPIGPAESQNVGVLRLKNRVRSLPFTTLYFTYILEAFSLKICSQVEGGRETFKVKAYLTLLRELGVRIVGDEVDEVLQTTRIIISTLECGYQVAKFQERRSVLCSDWSVTPCVQSHSPQTSESSGQPGSCSRWRT